MELICPNCKAKISPDNVNILSDLAECDICNSIHKASELADSKSIDKINNPLQTLNKFLIVISLMVISLSGLSQTKPSSISPPSQQTLYSLTQNCQEIVNVGNYDPNQMWKAKLEDGTYENMSVSFIGEILSLDVIGYYGINGYDTDLKKHLFKETEEYKQFEAELKTIRNELSRQTFFYLVPIDKNYNIEKKAFPLVLERIELGYPDAPGYLVFHNLCIEYATKRFPKNTIYTKKIFGGTNYFYKQTIFLQVNDLKKASAIEEAKKDACVLFLFKPDSVIELHGWINNGSYLKTKTTAIYIVNSKDGTVYCKVL